MDEDTYKFLSIGGNYKLFNIYTHKYEYTIDDFGERIPYFNIQEVLEKCKNNPGALVIEKVQLIPIREVHEQYGINNIQRL